MIIYLFVCIVFASSLYSTNSTITDELVRYNNTKKSFLENFRSFVKEQWDCSRRNTKQEPQNKQELNQKDLNGTDRHSHDSTVQKAPKNSIL